MRKIWKILSWKTSWISSIKRFSRIILIDKLIRHLLHKPMYLIFHIHLHRSRYHVQRSLLSTWYFFITSKLEYKLFDLISQNQNPHLFNSKEKLKYYSKSNEINLKQITIHLQIKNNENEQILCKTEIDYSRICSRCLSCSNGKK